MPRTAPRRALTLGLDFGTDSVRALVVDTADGSEIASAVAAYPRWAEGLFCDPAKQQFRQHPQDHLDALTHAVRAALAKAGKGAGADVVGLGVDTTGSSPLPVDRDGVALGLTDGFRSDPNALCVLWKDHTAIAEADELNALAHGGRFPDYTKYVGGIYSSEWWWAKIAHVLRASPTVAKAAYTWMEHCDWVPFVLSGAGDPARCVRSRCAAGHKGLWHASWGGLPEEKFLTTFEKRLAGLRARLYRGTATVDQSAGSLAPEWARTLGLPAGIPIAAGAFDCHLGAVGAGAGRNILVKVMGTSTCDMLITPPESLGKRTVRGICGQVDGSIVPGFIGLEAGQSAFGDVYAWYKRLLGWPLAALPAKVREQRLDRLLPDLEAAAAKLPPLATGELAIDWINGRRTPDADARVRGAITGLHLGSEAPAVYRALIEATAYGSRAIMDRIISEGVPVQGVLAIGGIARKSPLVMQICADVLARRILVAASDQCCALGSAIAAATVAGRYPSITAAQRAMASPVEHTYTPGKPAVKAYATGYARYQALGGFLAGTPA